MKKLVHFDTSFSGLWEWTQFSLCKTLNEVTPRLALVEGQTADVLTCSSMESKAIANMPQSQIPLCSCTGTDVTIRALLSLDNAGPFNCRSCFSIPGVNLVDERLS